MDYETKTSYSVTITVSDGNLTDSIAVTINVTDVDETPANNTPAFSAGASTTRTIAENTGSGVNIGSAVSATDADDDTLTYSLGGTDAAAFNIDSTSGQLRTSVSLDYETKLSYTVTITVSDGNGGSDSITVTINITDVDETPSNNAPTFSDSSTTRTIAENTGSGVNIGSAVSATDADDDTLTYSLGGTDAATFNIDSTSGQLRTSASLDYETKPSYTVTITVSDGNGGSDSITVTINITDVDETPSNNAPTFSDSSTTRTIAENTGSGVNIGSAVSATDADDDTLTYSLGGTDAATFNIDTAIGQLKTSASLDYETKSAYKITIIASDGSLTDSINVTINVTNVNEAPVFSNGTTTTRAIAENVGADINIGTVVAATDVDSTNLTYSLAGTDAVAFSIDTKTGQLKTKATLDYETKTSYTVTITVSDGSHTDIITVTINVTNLDETPSNNAPVLTNGDSTTRSIAENSTSGTNIKAAIAATDADNNTLAYLLSGTDAAAFAIDSTTGQLKTSAALDHETKAFYTVTVTVSDGTATDSITVTITVTDVNEAPVFADGSGITLSIAENTATGNNIGSTSTLSATDPDDDTLTYTLGSTDAASFSIVGTTGQLKTKSDLDYETKSSYEVTVSVSDGSLTDSIKVTINITDIDENRAPAFTDGTSATRSVAENTGSGVDIGTAVAATDADDDELTWTLSGIDAAAFSIDSTSGQLRTKAALDYETKTSYTVTVTVSDGSLTDSIKVTINITDIDENRAPAFTDGTSATRSVAENTGSGVDIGTAVAATDADDDELTWTLSGIDAAAFSIDSTSGQLRTKAALDYETKTSYTITITVSDGSLTDSIKVTINITDIDENRAPAFTDGTSATRSVAENTGSGVDIGTAVAATDADDDELTYTLGGTDAAAFNIDSTSGQLRTKSDLDYETKTSYTITITVSDGSLTDTIAVTINITDIDENRAPAFTDGTSATRSVAENTGSGVDIGTAVAATDADDDELTYTLGGTDAAAFNIDSTSGQLRTKSDLDYETKTSYTITITVSDGSLTDTIAVTINITDIDENRAPAFTDGTSATRSVAENTGSGVDIGTAVAATDADDDELTYTLGGTDAAAFNIDSTSGQLRTKSDLDYETKTSYTITITVSDGSLTDTIAVTINITDIDENRAPAFTDGTSATRSVAENTGSGVDIGTAVAATDADDDELTYTLGGTNAASFSIVSTSGQLKTRSDLDYETKSSYSVTISVSDGNDGSDSITVTINVTDVTENSAPVFTDGASTTRSIAENTAAGTNIGTPIAATDADNDTLTYTLGGTNSTSFAIVSTSGQLQTKAALNYERKTSYSVTVSVSDGNGGSDSITVTINITDVTNEGTAQQNINSAPTFTEGATATRSVSENTDAGENIGAPVAATDQNSEDTLTYSLSGTDAASFDIVSTSGQLQTKDALDYETKTSYSVTVSVSDGNSGSDSITVTINITDVDDSYLLYGRTPLVREAIVAVLADVNEESAVTETHLTEITELSIVGNFTGIYFSLKSLKVGDFSGLTALTSLTISYTGITSLDEDIFDGLSSLKTLAFTLNDITSLPEDIFADLTSLKTLDLGSNTFLGALPEDIFDGLSTLKEIDLTGCGFSTLPEDIFDGLSNLETLNFRRGDFTSLPEDLFDGLTSLKYLNLNASELTALHEDIFDGLSALEILDLSSNDFPSLHEDVFDGLSELKTLDLGACFLSSLHEDLFDGLSALETLDLRSNNLTALDADIFDGLSSLKKLDLSVNVIESYPDGIFSGLTSLTDLNVDIGYVSYRNHRFTVTLEKTESGKFKAIYPIGATYNITIPLIIENGSITGGVSSVTLSTGSTESAELTVTRTAGTTGAVTVTLDLAIDRGTLQILQIPPDNHDGYYLLRSDDLPLTVIDAVGGAPTTMNNDTVPTPKVTALLANFPNPFNPETWIPYQLSKSADVTLLIYNMQGVVVRQLKLGQKPAGVYLNRSRAIHWDGRNSIGEKVATGVYFYTLTAGDFTATRKMLIVK